MVALLLGIGTIACPGASAAGCQWVQTEELISGAIRIKTEKICTGSAGEGGTSESAADLPPRDSGWDAVCVRNAIDLGADPRVYCDLPVDEVAPAVQLTPGRVASAFRELPLPAAHLVIQPPNGRTLVNFDTNFYTEQGELSRTVTLLGRQVELRIWPASFTWRFGDGASRQTTSPGSAYPHLEITHQYQRQGRVAPSVDTTYAAQFRVDGGAWRDVNGTVTIPGSPQSLRVVTARPVLVGG